MTYARTLCLLLLNVMLLGKCHGVHSFRSYDQRALRVHKKALIHRNEPSVAPASRSSSVNLVHNRVHCTCKLRAPLPGYSFSPLEQMSWVVEESVESGVWSLWATFDLWLRCQGNQKLHADWELVKWIAVISGILFVAGKDLKYECRLIADPNAFYR